MWTCQLYIICTETEEKKRKRKRDEDKDNYKNCSPSNTHHNHVTQIWLIQIGPERKKSHKEEQRSPSTSSSSTDSSEGLFYIDL